MDLSEQQRLAVITAEHQAQPHAATPPSRLGLHLKMHLVVENQLAANEPAAVKETLERLIGGGLSRHQAVHAIGSVVSDEIINVLKDRLPFNEGRYNEALRRLDAGNGNGETAT